MIDTAQESGSPWLLLQIIIVGSVVSSLLRMVISKDSVFKVAALGLTLSSIVCCSNRLNRQSRLHSSFFIYSLITYITIIGLIKFAQYSFIRKKSSQRNLIQLNQLIVPFSILYFILSVFIYCISYNVLFGLLRQDHFALSIIILLVSLGLLVKVDHYFLDKGQEAIKRKLFHIGPIVTIPFIYQLNPQLLIFVLTVGFYTFFILQYIRYLLKEINFNYKNDDLPILKYIDIISLFVWMTKFNRRQHHFWFTHLFLILSLLFSYQMSYLLAQKNGQHFVLVVIAADGLAALIGKFYGKIKIYQNKTLEGTVSFIITFFLGYLMLVNQSTDSWLKGIILSVLCGLGELFGGDADNITTILIVYTVEMISK